MDFQTVIANYSRGFPGDPRVSVVDFVGELGFSQGLDVPKCKAVESAFESRAAIKPQLVHPPPMVSKTANGG